MKERIIVSAFSSLVVVAGLLLCLGNRVGAAGGVAIDETNFPDDHFRAFVKTSYDKDSDDYLSEEELGEIKSLSIQGAEYEQVDGDDYEITIPKPEGKIEDLKGIETFSSLKQISLKYMGHLKNVNLNGCDTLETFDCYSTSIVFLDLGNCHSLTNLGIYLPSDCYESGPEEGGCTITSLNVSGCEQLGGVDCHDCYVEELFVSGCSAMHTLNCSYNKITKLDLTDCISLTYLNCANNQLNKLIIDELSPLKKIYCYNNKLTELDVRKSSDLELLECENNQIELLDVSRSIVLESLVCSNNQIAVLDVSQNKKLKSLDCSHNRLTRIDVSENNLLEVLRCESNSLTTIDICNNSNLKTMFCGYNKIDNIVMKNNSALRYLCCVENCIDELDLCECPDLLCLDCGKATSVDISNNRFLIDAYKKGKIIESLVGWDECIFLEYCYHARVDDSTIYLYFPDYEYDQSGMSGYGLGLCVGKETSVITQKPTVTPTITPTVTPVVNITLDKSESSIKCGESDKLTATVTGTKEAVTWTSSDKKIAVVNKAGKITTKMAGTVTITATVAGKSATCTVTIMYKDVTNTKDFWFKPTNYLTAAGVVKGYDKQTKFKPANKCTRAQMVTFIWRLAGEPEPTSKTCKFKDVKKKDYFYKACIWGNEKHIVEGYKDGTFGPQIVCARKHAVTFLWRLAEKPEPTTKKNKFKDVKKKDYFYKATLWASEEGILAGYKDGTFKPGGDCLRRQMVTFLYKYDKYVNGKG